MSSMGGKELGEKEEKLVKKQLFPQGNRIDDDINACFFPILSLILMVSFDSNSVMDSSMG